MNGLIWIAAAIFMLEFVHGESNPYKEAMLARPWESVQDYVTVRPGAHMFYWLYYADGTSTEADRKPLIIWIQGGPGLAASGVGNFAEIGPLTMNMEPRNHTWVKRRNVLLFDHPVGSGFSYVRNITLLPKTDREVANDLSSAIKEFLRKHKRFRETPTYIIGQSYGGKICPRLAYYLNTAIEKKSLKMNLKGIGIGSGWVNPQESIMMRPVFLHNMGLIDVMPYINSTMIAEMVRDYCNKQDYIGGLNMTAAFIEAVSVDTGASINTYNVYQPSHVPALVSLQRTVNTYVKPTLSHVVDQSLEWNYNSKDVFQRLIETYVVPSVSFLETLLNRTEVKVVIYNGNLDAITSVAGASNWVHKLKWHGSEEFKRAKRRQIRGTNNGFYKIAKQLSLWWVFGAGHWVPEENPMAMEQILEYLISDNV